MSIRPAPTDTTPAQYGAGSIKQQPPTFHGVYDHAHSHIGLRTNLASVGMDWFCMCPYTGGHYTSYDEVVDWADIYVTP